MRRAWAAAAAGALNGAWMLVDGSVALATGDYIGDELGPWAALLRAVGVDPLSRVVAAAFALYGAAYLALLAAYALRPARLRSALAAATAPLLAYLAVGTLVAAATLALLLAERRSAPPAQA
ncbi:MAG TPA: hypothetical protein VNX21_02275 [Candidatus Thermoplasmatota archaeon]|nr:hypothetical protein [Candidatus Thermoplasmatota archaeon]